MYRRLDGSTNIRADIRDHIEHDKDIPNDIVIATPGGVSGLQHHYTKGLYSKGDTSSDIYGNASNRYISAEYGNIYRSGHSASTNMLADASTTSLNIHHLKSPVTPIDPNYTSERAEKYIKHRDSDYKQLKETFRYETLSKYNTGPDIDSNIEYIPLPEEFKVETPRVETPRQNASKEKSTSLRKNTRTRQVRFNQYLVFFLVVILYISFGFWYDGIVTVLSNTFHKGRTITATSMFMYGGMLTLLFFAIIYFADIPLVTFEDVA